MLPMATVPEIADSQGKELRTVLRMMMARLQVPRLAKLGKTRVKIFRSRTTQPGMGLLNLVLPEAV